MYTHLPIDRHRTHQNLQRFGRLSFLSTYAATSQPRALRSSSIPQAHYPNWPIFGPVYDSAWRKHLRRSTRPQNWNDSKREHGIARQNGDTRLSHTLAEANSRAIPSVKETEESLDCSADQSGESDLPLVSSATAEGRACRPVRIARVFSKGNPERTSGLQDDGEKGHVTVESPSNERKRIQGGWKTEHLHRKLKSLLKDIRCPHDALIDTFKGFPEPRAAYLSENVRKGLLHRLSVVEASKRDSATFLRYMFVFESVEAAKIPLELSEWNNAISFAGRCVFRISDGAIQDMLGLWKKMESEAGVQASAVTFNLLFNIAVHSGRFHLAELFKEEMELRGLRFTRHFRTNILYYHGLRGDGLAVQKEYDDLVKAGEIVDTAVMNALICAQLNCGDVGAAEHSFIKMKVMHSQKSKTRRTITPRSKNEAWLYRRKTGKEFENVTRNRELRPTEYEKAKDRASIAPDIVTYRALIKHYAVQAGDLDRVTELADEMSIYGFVPHSSIYFYLMTGFIRHGKDLYTQWHVGRLESTFAAMIAALDSEESEVVMHQGLALATLWAFAAKTSRERTEEIWAEIQKRWDGDSDGIDFEDVWIKASKHKPLNWLSY